ncbi:hypothetical protein SK128_012116, partial [Halocaridina rubra]
MDASAMVELPTYEYAPPWLPPAERAHHQDYNNDLQDFMARSVTLVRDKVSDA